jgi:hypothetical protein
MTPQQIIERFAAYVDQHEQGERGLHHQEPYKGDFFTLFVETYNRGYMGIHHHPRLTAGGLKGALSGHIALESPLLQELFGFWEEWTYAWDRAAQRAG